MIGISLPAAAVLLALMFPKTKTSYLMNNVAASSSKISFFVRTEQDKHVASFFFLFFSPTSPLPHFTICCCEISKSLALFVLDKQHRPSGRRNLPARQFFFFLLLVIMPLIRQCVSKYIDATASNILYLRTRWQKTVNAPRGI